MSINEILELELISFGEVQLSVYHLLEIMILLLISWIIIRISKKIINRRITGRKFDKGRGEAFYQIVKYLVLVIAILVGLDIVGVELTLLLGASAALLVGFGLGIQQIFYDIVSGIILLFEGTVAVDDIVEVTGIIGKVKKINLRTSNMETRDGIVIIVPNSKLVGDNVINWSHNRSPTRFTVSVGVAYGSDVPLVKKLIVEAALEQNGVVGDPEPVAWFVDFGDSSLDFEVKFWSTRLFNIEALKSEIRTAIDEKFRNNKVTIPFPQRDLHVKEPVSFESSESEQ